MKNRIWEQPLTLKTEIEKREHLANTWNIVCDGDGFYLGNSFGTALDFMKEIVNTPEGDNYAERVIAELKKENCIII